MENGTGIFGKSTVVEPEKRKVNKKTFILEIPTDLYQRIIGQDRAKKAAVIALAGGFSICFYGPSGHGKTSLVRWFSKTHTKLYNKQPEKGTVYECDFPDASVDIQIFAEIRKVGYSAIHNGFDKVTSKEVEKAIRKMVKYPTYEVEEAFWDIIGQEYSAQKLTPKIVFNTIRVGRIMANLENSSLITKEHIKEALKLTTFPVHKRKTDAPTKKMKRDDVNLEKLTNQVEELDDEQISETLLEKYEVKEELED